MLVQVSLRSQEVAEPCYHCGANQGVARYEINTPAGCQESSPTCVRCLSRYPIRVYWDQEAGTRLKAAKLRRAVKRQEKELADLFDGHTQKASGATAWCKGDARLPFKYLGEAKRTAKDSFTLHRRVLDKLRAECSQGEIPVVSIDFTDERSKTEDSWLLIPMDKVHKLT